MPPHIHPKSTQDPPKIHPNPPKIHPDPLQIHPRSTQIHPGSTPNPEQIYWTSIENQSKIYRTSIENQSKIYRTSIENLSTQDPPQIHPKSTQDPIHPNSTPNSSQTDRKSISHILKSTFSHFPPCLARLRNTIPRVASAGIAKRNQFYPLGGRAVRPALRASIK